MHSKAHQESLSNLRSRGGHGFPAFNAARLASRIATIFFACARVSSRRLATPPRRPMFARYSRTRFSASVIEASFMHRKPVMMRGKKVQNESRLKRTKVRFGEPPKPAREPHALPSLRPRLQAGHSAKIVPEMIPGFGAGLVIETRSLPNLLVATLATLPSMSLIPSAPFPICGNRRQCAR